MLCVEAPEANILVCKGYKCTKNQAPNYILLQNQVISSSNIKILLTALNTYISNLQRSTKQSLGSLERNHSSSNA